MKLSFLLAAALVTALVGCEKNNPNPDGLPPATQEGKNTGGFLLNGVVFKPNISTPGSLLFQVSWGRNGYGMSDRISIAFGRHESSNRSSSFAIYLGEVLGPGQQVLRTPANPYVVASGPGGFIEFVDVFSPADKRSYYTGPTAVSVVNITRFDPTARVIAGTFEAKLRQYNGPDSLAITKGRFDLTF